MLQALIFGKEVLEYLNKSETYLIKKEELNNTI